MSWTAADVADAVWTNLVRTLDPGVPPPSNGSPVDNIAYAIWTYSTRTASGGVASFQINVAQTMPAPGQSATLQTVMPVTVEQTMPTPSQTITAETSAATFEITVNQTMPAPSQSSTLEAQGGAVKSKDGGAWEYYPPIYAIRTKGKQSVPAPNQGGFVKAEKPIVYADPIPQKNQSVVYGMQSMPLPGQCVIMKSHRTIKKRDDEEEKILMLLMGVA
jgi:hypothetical protein